GLFVDDAKSGASFMGLPRPSILAAAMSPYLWVNPHGVRFVDEGLGNGPYLASAVSRQKNRTSFTIMDSNAKRHLQENGLELNTYMDVMPTKLGDLDNDIQAALAEGNISAQMGESIEELAAKIKINPATLQQTIDAYNACCDKGHDDLFAKNPRFLRPVSTPPFYAFQCSAIGYGTIGGIKINERAEAVDKDCDSIPGLYAAGDCAAGTLTYDYPLVYILWGCTLGFAVNSGRIAGESSAAYIKSLSK
ncbi:MAG: FAD-binding protein, partial [Desulfatitalea sp.]|nr:FAD-binding protein [Desulfatitalea sp.]NNK02211.1 FAD-binding protein [Desulfatitalea sp.]